MHAPDRIRVVRTALRLSLATAFLSAVADRFGWWEPFGQGALGSMTAFADYTHQLVPFAPGWLLTAIVWTATATESTRGVLLLTDVGLHIRWHRIVWGAVELDRGESVALGEDSTVTDLELSGDGSAAIR